MVDCRQTVVFSIFLVFLLLVEPSISQQCEKSGVCKCIMSDESGEVNLNSLAATSGVPRWTLDGLDGYEYHYNPCLGFSGGTFTDLAVYQVHLGNDEFDYDLGVQSSEEFEYTSSRGLAVKYLAADGKRKSAVVLVCNPNVVDHYLEFMGELVTTEYDFLLVGACACPGRCDDYGIIEEKIPQSNGVNWNTVGIDLVGLIFHDVMLVIVIISIVVIIRSLANQPGKSPNVPGAAPNAPNAPSAPNAPRAENQYEIPKSFDNVNYKVSDEFVKTDLP